MDIFLANFVEFFADLGWMGVALGLIYLSLRILFYFLMPDIIIGRRRK